MVFAVTSLNKTTERAMSHLSHPPLLAMTRVQQSTQNVETSVHVEVRFSGTRYATGTAFIIINQHLLETRMSYETSQSIMHLIEHSHKD